MLRLYFFFCLTFLSNIQAYLYAQKICPSSSAQPYEWPSQRNWLIATNLYAGKILNTKTLKTTSVGNAWRPVQAYEGVTTVSDDNGDLLFFSSGRRIQDANGRVLYSGLLTGNEGGSTGNSGSASQGIISIRHPLNPDHYYFLTTDDALNGTSNGLNYAIIDKNGVMIQNTTRLGNYRTTEGIAATWHQNKIDIWVTVTQSGSNKIHSYLLKCDGFSSGVVTSFVGIPTGYRDAERGGVAFSWNSKLYVSGFGSTSGAERVRLYNFDNSTGLLSLKRNIGKSLSNVGSFVYDVTFSPDNSRVLASSNTGQVFSINTATGVGKSIVSSSGSHSAIEIGADGSLYRATLGTSIKKLSGNLNNGSNLSSSSISGAIGSRGLTTMFLPPAEKPDIQEVNTYCSNNPPVDLNTIWICSGNDAEDLSENPLAYSGIGITDRANGIFDPSKAGPGKHQIIFQYCSVSDTIWITVNNCNSCSVELKDIQPEICVGESLILDTYLIKTPRIGEWLIDSFPTGVLPVITDGSDTVFDASGLAVTSGVYKLKYKVIDESPECYDSIYITVNSNPIPDLGPDNPICEGNGPVIFDVGLYDSYLWQPTSETSQSISVVKSGEYIVTVTDSNNCVGNDTVKLTVNSIPVPDLGPEKAICEGTGPVIFDAGLYNSYVWQPTSETSQSISVVESGEYIVTVTDSNNCAGNDTVKLIVNSNPIPNLGPDNSICEGTGPVIFDVGLYDSYLWQPTSETSQSISVVESGEYIVTVTDSNNCVGNDTAKLTVNSNPTPNLGPEKAICEVSGPVIFDAGLYDSYLWQPTSETSQSISVVKRGEYIVTVTDSNNCVGNDTVKLTVNSIPVPDLGPDKAICEGSGPVIFDAGLYNSYVWQPTSETSQSISVVESGEYIVTVLGPNSCLASDTINLVTHSVPILDLGPDIISCPDIDTTLQIGSQWQNILWNNLSSNNYFNIFSDGVYYVDVIDVNGCSNSDTLIVDYLEIKAVNLGDDITICMGAEAVFNLDFYPDYLWSDGSRDDKYVSTSDEIIWVQVQDINGCFSTDTAQVFISKSLPVNLGKDTEFCEGDSIKISSGYPKSGYKFVWSNKETSPNITISSSGVYDILIEDLVGCIGRDTVLMTMNSSPQIDLGPDKQICSGLTNSFDAGTGWAKTSWNTSDTSLSITVSKQGEYFVIVEDINGCKSADTAFLKVYNNPKPYLGSDQTICSGSSVLFTVSNYENYVWNNGDTLNQYISSDEGQVYVSVTDSNGCIGSDTAIVIISENVFIDLGSDIDTCSNDSIKLTVGYQTSLNTFLWNTGETAKDISVNSTGIYFVKVTDNNGCNSNDTISVSLRKLPTINLGSNKTICDGDSVLLDPGNGWSEMIWSDDYVGQINTVKTAGNYSVTVTDENGCVGSDEINLNVNDIPIITLGPDMEVCPGTEVSFSAMPHDFKSYLWHDGSKLDNFETSNPQLITVLVTDENGCSAKDSVQLKNFPSVDVYLPPNQTICDGDFYQISVPDFNIENHTFLWNDESTDSILRVENAGLYSVFVTNVNGCTGFDTIRLEVNPIPMPLVDNKEICENENTIISTDLFKSYLWNTGEKTREIEVSLEGLYTVTVEDTNGCQGNGSGKLIIHSNPLIPDLSDQVFCEGEEVVLFPELPEGDYYWKEGGEETPSITVSDIGEYEVVVETVFGCLDSISISVSEILSPILDLGPDKTICDGESVFIGVKQENSIITWSTGDVSDSIAVNATGFYEATLTDSNTCSVKDSVYINVLKNPKPFISNDTLVCFEEINNLSLTVVSGPRDHFLWSTGDSTNSTIVYTEGSYEVIATNFHGCIGKDTIEVGRECPSLLFLPSAFTPNDDGINDFFGPKAINIFDFDFYIFNRWGELLFHSTNINNHWDGTFQGIECQIDIYIWKLFYRTEREKGGLKRQQDIGNVTLLR